MSNEIQKITLYSQKQLDGTWLVSRLVCVGVHDQKSVTGFKVVDNSQFICKNKSSATRKLNQLVKQECSCEFFIQEKVISEKGIEEVLELDKGQVFNTVQTLWFPIGQLELTVGNGNSVADVTNSQAQTSTPHSNTGGLKNEQQGNETTKSKFSQDLSELTGLTISEPYIHQVMEKGRLKEIMLRRGVDSPAFIDTISFVINECVYNELIDGELIGGFQAVKQAIFDVSQAMGLKPVKEVAPRNNYKNTLQFGDVLAERNYGFVAWGGETQRETIMFHFTGEGLSVARNGWEKYLYLLLSKMESHVHITRIDISHDFINGEYTIDKAVLDWKDDCYTVRQTKPQAEMQGVDWLSGTKYGRTFYIGSKKSSRILFFYEKGKQLGDEDSSWVRLELKQRNKDYIIPLDSLIHAGDYLCTAYPYLTSVLNYNCSDQKRFVRVKKVNGIAKDHVTKYASMQVSPAIKMLKQFGMTDEQIIKELLNEKAKLPKRLVLRHQEIELMAQVKSLKEAKQLSQIDFNPIDNQDDNA